MTNYIIAIPTYQRAHTLVKKTLNFLFSSHINMDRVFIFVASQDEYDTYLKVVPYNLYNKLVIGVLGITAQRNFISDYFPVGQQIVSLDDDITRLMILEGRKLVLVKSINDFFNNAFEKCTEHALFIWGIYPTDSIMFMNKGELSTSFKFIIGAFYGYINRKLECLRLNVSSECKEDIEQSILYYKCDEGVIRFNNVCSNPCVASEGGLGKDRRERNEAACTYLLESYPTYLRAKQRSNGMKELRFLRR